MIVLSDFLPAERAWLPLVYRHRADIGRTVVAFSFDSTVAFRCASVHRDRALVIRNILIMRLHQGSQYLLLYQTASDQSHHGSQAAQQGAML